MGPGEGSIEASLTALAELQHQGLVRHIGISNVTPTQVAEARGLITFVCVQNLYNIAHQHDNTLIDELARDGIAYVPFFPLGGFTPLQSSTLSNERRCRAGHGRPGATHQRVYRPCGSAACHRLQPGCAALSRHACTLAR